MRYTNRRLPLPVTLTTRYDVLLHVIMSFIARFARCVIAQLHFSVVLLGYQSGFFALTARTSQRSIKSVK